MTDTPVTEAPVTDAPAAEAAAMDDAAPSDGSVLTEDDLFAAEADAGDEAPDPVSPYDKPGKWFVVHTQSGYEKKVKQNLEARTASMNMEGRIHEVVIRCATCPNSRTARR